MSEADLGYFGLWSDPARDPFNDFGFNTGVRSRKQFGENGLIGPDEGTLLIVVDASSGLADRADDGGGATEVGGAAEDGGATTDGEGATDGEGGGDGVAATDRGATEDTGTVADHVVGDVSWHAVPYGPPGAGHAFNIGIRLLPEHRGHGYGGPAQRLLAGYLLGIHPVNRIEASTDVENKAEQRALEKAGFQREGVVRGAQWRRGAWHDLVVYSRLRDDA